METMKTLVRKIHTITYDKGLLIFIHYILFNTFLFLTIYYDYRQSVYVADTRNAESYVISLYCTIIILYSMIATCITPEWVNNRKETLNQ